MPGSAAATIAAHVLERMSPHHPTILVGPVCWLPCATEPSGKEWYFTVVSYDDQLQRCAWDCATFRSHDAQTLAAAQRAAVILVLLQHPPIVVHDCDDELYMARLAEAAWPGPRISAVRQDIERERA